jgi:hydrogenase expression/formation protein HypE
VLSQAELETARRFLYQPGISILRDAQIAARAGQVTAMHDPTEGGLAGALWELSQACGQALHVELEKVPIPDLSRRICTHLGLDPLASIASGALLLACRPGSTPAILQALQVEGIPCAQIGRVGDGPPGVWVEDASPPRPLPWPARDDLARLFE